MTVHDAKPARFVSHDPGFMDRMIAERRRIGVDRFDEVWDGVYHMSPPPSTEHARIECELLFFLAPIVRQHKLGEVLAELGVREPGSGDQNFRVADLVFVSTARAARLSEWGCEGGPDVVFEVRSPRDATYEKLPFYAVQGAREVVVIHRDTRQVELFRPVRGQMEPVPAAADGWLVSEPLGVAFRTLERDGKPALEARDTRDPARSVVI